MDSNLFWSIVGLLGGAFSSFLISYFFISKAYQKKV